MEPFAKEQLYFSDVANTHTQIYIAVWKVTYLLQGMFFSIGNNYQIEEMGLWIAAMYLYDRKRYKCCKISNECLFNCGIHRGCQVTKLIGDNCILFIPFLSTHDFSLKYAYSEHLKHSTSLS